MAVARVVQEGSSGEGRQKGNLEGSKGRIEGREEINKETSEEEWSGRKQQ